MLSMSQGLNRVTKKMEELGLVILKDENRDYVTRGNRNIKINGENIKPLLAAAVEKLTNVMDLIKDYDFIIDGTDNFPAKFLINDACVMAKKPFSHAGIIRFKGQLMTYVPGE